MNRLSSQGWGEKKVGKKSRRERNEGKAKRGEPVDKGLKLPFIQPPKAKMTVPYQYAFFLMDWVSKMEMSNIPLDSAKQLP